MSNERDIIIERLEQKLAARDKEIAKMQESLRESIVEEMEKRFAEKIKLRESTLDELRMKLPENDAIRECESRLSRLERRLIELNSSYDGVMKELLDQKSILQELKVKKEVKPKEEETKTKQEPKEETKPPEKPRSKSQYIVAGNYVPKERKKQQIIEAEEKAIVAEEPEKEQVKKAVAKKSQNIVEGVEIVETLKKR